MIYDAIIVGAGPAGSQSAYYLAKAGLKVVIFEKRKTVGYPIRCAEAVGLKEDIEKFFPIDEAWYAGDIYEGTLFGPNGIGANGKLFSTGIIVNRDRFDQFLYNRAISAGAHGYTNANVIGFERQKDALNISVEINNTINIFQTKLLVGADGIESQVGRWAGLYNTLKPNDILTCFEYQIKTDEDKYKYTHLYFFLGHQIAPGGYAWIFPKKNNIYNVGIGINIENNSKKPAKEYLDKFISQHFSNFEIIKKISGGVPLIGNIDFVTDNIVLVGDAAGHCNPLSGGGIMNALEAGFILGTTLPELIKDNKLKKDALMIYSKTWNKKNGKAIKYYYKMKNIFYKLSDDELNDFVHILKQVLKEEKKGMQVPDVIKIFLKTIRKNYKLLYKFSKTLF